MATKTNIADIPPDPDAAETLRETIDAEVADRLGGPNEAITDALMVFASREVARIASAEMAACWRAQDVYRKFFTDSQVGRDSYREFIGKLQAELFEALYGKPRSDSIWLDQISPEQHRAENPHHPCGRDEPHDGHVWRGSRREFGGACEVTRTYWCEGIARGESLQTTTPNTPKES
jgi:hypothetical protein